MIVDKKGKLFEDRRKEDVKVKNDKRKTENQNALADSKTKKK